MRDVQTLLSIAVLFLAGQTGTTIAYPLASSTRAESNFITLQRCDNALAVLVQHSSLPASSKDGLTAILEGQDDVQATIGLFSGANWNIALGWIRIDWANHQLLDLTNDIEAPIRLTFRRIDWVQAVACLRGLPIAR